MIRYLVTDGMPTYGHYPKAYRSAIARPSIEDAVRLESTLDWDDVRKLRDGWPGKLIVKGILSVADAEKAAAVGADGIVVSAHGGRNLDCLPAPATCLPSIVEAVGSRLTVMADSGVRRGSDVLKYLALGANAVMLGRVPLWGLAAAGQDGAEAILRLTIREMDTAWAFSASTIRHRCQPFCKCVLFTDHLKRPVRGPSPPDASDACHGPAPYQPTCLQLNGKVSETFRLRPTETSAQNYIAIVIIVMQLKMPSG
jgi:hypothetical protein